MLPLYVAVVYPTNSTHEEFAETCESTYDFVTKSSLFVLRLVNFETISFQLVAVKGSPELTVERAAYTPSTLNHANKNTDNDFK
jgi:hypothetical protein